MGREEIFFGILLFFALFTGIIGIINLAAGGAVTSATLSTAISGGAQGVIPGQMSAMGSAATYREGANTAPGIALGGLDFTTTTVLDTNVTTFGGGAWELITGKGLVLTSLPILPFGPGSDSQIFLRNTQSNGNVYTVNVVVDNSEAGGDWYVLPRSYADLNTVYDLKVTFEADGIHIKKAVSPFEVLMGSNSDAYFYPLPGARDTITGGSTITTVLTEIPGSESLVVGEVQSNSILTVSKDGLVLFTTAVGNGRAGPINNDDVRHGGVGASTQNFIVKGFPSTNIISTPETIISNAGDRKSVV